MLSQMNSAQYAEFVHQEQTWGDDVNEVPNLEQLAVLVEQLIQHGLEEARDALENITGQQSHQPPRRDPNTQSHIPLNLAGGRGSDGDGEFVSNEIFVHDSEYRRLQGITAMAYQQFFDGSNRTSALQALQQIQHPQSFVPLSRAA